MIDLIANLLIVIVRSLPPSAYALRAAAFVGEEYTPRASAAPRPHRQDSTRHPPAEDGGAELRAPAAAAARLRLRRRAACSGSGANPNP
eukprot:scaffold66262_cov62-Phaeocystis_antarctica.AAC.3